MNNPVTGNGYIVLGEDDLYYFSFLIISCSTKRQIMTLSPPVTIVKLQPACSGYSSSIKLPAYVKQYSKCIEVAF